MRKLPARTALILRRRLGVDGKCLTYRECAADLGITAEWARKIEAKGLASPVFERLWGENAVSPLAQYVGKADLDIADVLPRPWAAGLSEESLRTLLRVARTADTRRGERAPEQVSGARTGT
nr:sigma factor-like helix-turn-helix DNA-binding protein [Enterovirga sp. DB1703]